MGTTGGESTRCLHPKDSLTGVTDTVNVFEIGELVGLGSSGHEFEKYRNRTV